ncbi:50S ribosomal protein L14e [Acidianus brierleyi]|uniref:Large ribosomal subunit protein eL14 n=1 Tax=Acidianus brierleyi TaxID=41673 RepID=A0A2U9IEU0_9CREN|nr:50S ribosomal protein L14e [Acidianus brierleyi]AWR94515.1 50S ribosomal protein L14e [Acidianus brierleyi]
MPVIEIGRICVKTRGREAGSKCVIVDIIDDNFVLVTGPKKVSGIKRRRLNIAHLEPTDKKIDIQKGATDEEIEKKLQEAGLTDFVKEKIKIKIPVI